MSDQALAEFAATLPFAVELETPESEYSESPVVNGVCGISCKGYD